MRTMDGNLKISRRILATSVVQLGGFLINKNIVYDFKRQFYPYTIYTNQNHEYHAENLIFYSIEQKGLFTDNGRRTPPPQKAPMGSRLTSFLLSVRACGSSQGESPAAVCQRVREN